MAIDIRLKHSSVQDKAPLAADLVAGELAVNIHEDSAAIYLKDSAGNVRKIAAVASANAPTTPVSGDTWVDTSTNPATINVWDPTAGGGAGAWVPVAGGTVTGPGLTGIWDRVGTVISPVTNGDKLVLNDGTGTASVDLDAGASVSPLVRDSNGRVGIAKANPVQTLDVNGTIASSSQITVWGGTTGQPSLVMEPDRIYGTSAGVGPGPLLLNPAGGNVGIGTATPTTRLDVWESTGASLFRLNGLSSYNLDITNNHDGGGRYDFGIGSGAGAFSFTTSAGERARIDSSGRLLVGTSSSDASRLGTSTYNPQFQVKGAWSNGTASITCTNDYPVLWLNGTAAAVVNSGVGKISFNAFDGTNYTQAAVIDAEIDGTPAANDMPGRLEFSTTPSGSATPVERMRIKSNGTINFSNVAVYADNTAATAGGLVAGDIYRKADGTLMITF